MTDAAKARLQTWLPAVAIFTGMFAGGSASKPILEMTITLVALGALLVHAWMSEPDGSELTAVSIVVGTAVMLALSHVIPLPWPLWESLPQGRLAQVLPREVRPPLMWRTLSISPDSTLYSLTALVPAIVTLWLVAGLRTKQLITLINLIIIAAVVIAATGIAQATRFVTMNLYETQHPNVAIGVFASRNHFADLLIISVAMLFAIRWIWSRKFGRAVSELIFHGVLVLFVGAAIASSSRAGVVLVVLTTLIGYCLSMKPRLRARSFGIGVAGLVCFTYLLRYIPKAGALKTTMARFEWTDDGRWQIWQNSVGAIRRYWPWGSGLGTFRIAYEQSEPVRSITPSYINAAHNEYLQLLVEGGIFGVVAASVITITIGLQGWKYRADPFVPFALLGLGVVLVHALVDYPFRVIGINVLAAFLCALVVRRRFH